MAILDRAYGRPPQALQHSYSGDPLDSLRQALSDCEVFRPAEFGNICAMGLALGQEVQADYSIRAQIDGMSYCFANEDAKATFMKDAQGNLAKARAYKRRLRP